MTGKVFQYENHYEMKKNRLKVLEDADHVCQHCGGTATVVHHIDNSISNHSPENLMPLCQKCHSRLHCAQNKIRWDGRMLEAAMIHKGIDRKELAERAGITYATVHNIINHGRTKNSTMKKIADVLEHPVEAFVMPQYIDALIRLDAISDNVNPLKSAILKRISELTTDKVLHRRFHIWIANGLREKFNVNSYFQIPPEKLTEAIAFIKNWRK